MSLRVESFGLLTTVQDLGRRGFQHLGVGPTGAMDEVSHRLANLLLGFFTTVDILPWALALLGHREWLLPLSLWSASRLLCAFAFREPFSAWLWSPLGTLLIPLVALASWRGKRKGSLRWKGRLLELRTGWEGEKA